jgi:hypothetical protein
MRILIVGNFNYGPNFAGILDFFKSYGAEFDSRFTFFVIGKCNREEQLIAAIKGSCKNFQLERILYADQMDVYYQQADFCLNYVNYGSGENVKMLEALIHRRPVINTSYGENKLKDLFNILCIQDEFKPTVTIEVIIKSDIGWFDFLLNARERQFSNVLIFEKLYFTYCKERLKEFKFILDNCG